jgi:hypothetical protein
MSLQNILDALAAWLDRLANGQCEPVLVPVPVEEPTRRQR